MNKEIEKIYNRIPDEQDFIPDLELFTKTLFALNPNGNPDFDYSHYLTYISSETDTKRPGDGKPISFKFVISQYDKYIDNWESEYGDKDPKYIKGTDKLQKLTAWISAKGYLNVITLSKSKASTYILGGFSEEVLRKKLGIFNAILKRGDINEQEEEPELEIKNAAGNSQGGSEEPF